MKILITGGTTFVSKYTAEFYVKAGHEVTVLNRGSRKQIKGVNHICCERSQAADFLKGRHFDAVFDITAYNENDIRHIIESGVTFDDYIFISSSAVYPETNEQPFNEEQQCGYNNFWGDYGINKINAERYLMQQFPGAYILRPPYFYGIYDNLYREAFPFDCAMQDREFYIPGDGSLNLQFFNVSDLCRFMSIIHKKHPSRHIFNVGNSEPVTIKEWVGMCYKAAGKEARFISVDKTAYPLWNYFCFRDYEYFLDISAQSELRSETLPLQEGLQEEFNWYRDNPDSIYNRKPYIEFIDKELKK